MDRVADLSRRAARAVRRGHAALPLFFDGRRRGRLAAPSFQRPREPVVEQLGGAVELRLARAHRRHKAQHAALAALAEDQAVLKAIAGYRLAERIGRLAAVAGPRPPRFPAEGRAAAHT